MPILDHDIILKNGELANVAKGDDTAKRPHADGCVGCRRTTQCINCGQISAFAPLNSAQPGRCNSGACPTCCADIHVHANNNINDIVMSGAAAR